MSQEYNKLLQSALLEVRSLKQQLRQAQENRAPEGSIAVVGMACRFGGHNNSPQEFAQFLDDKGDAVGALPSGRWQDNYLLDAAHQTVGSLYTSDGGYLDDVYSFDESYFDISAREAVFIDPQQRHLLELSVKALEDADELEGCANSNTGLFMTTGEVNYAERTLLSAIPARKNGAAKLGANRSIGVGRIAHILKLEGPAIFLDTTCSSSLLAIHTACESLRKKEIDMALAGGFNLMLSSNDTVGFCALQALSPDGRCRSFSESANGYGRGEGGAVVVLKRLEDAVKDGNSIYGLIHGGAINNDGDSNGLTAPNGRAQQKVILKALENARVKPEQVKNIEAHGTGTPLGDPIELNALVKALRSGEQAKQPLVVGSVKSNLGHLEAAAGMAAFVKVMLAYRAGRIFASLHADRLNTNFRWNDYSIEVADGSHKLAVDDHTGISGFGMSGTNVHLVVSGYKATAREANLKTPAYPVLPFSAHSAEALQRQIAALHQNWPIEDDRALQEAAALLNYRRGKHGYRVAFGDKDVAKLRQQLSDWLERPIAVQANKGKAALLFTGQGSEFGGMGKAFYQSETDFRQCIDQIAPFFERHTGVTPTALMWGEQQNLLQQTKYQQPALVLYQYALAKLLASQGIKADVLLGHSLGEFAAAAVAGIFSIEQAIELVALRGILVSRTEAGRMLMVWANAVQLAELGLPADIALAVENTPSISVISGAQSAVEQYAERLKGQNVRCHMMPAKYAFHSQLMSTIAEPWLAALQHVDFNPAAIDIISNVSGKLNSGEMSTPGYWAQQLVGTVKFAAAVANLNSLDVGHAIELGPKSHLRSLGRVQSRSISWLAVDECSSDDALTRLWARLFELGYQVPAKPEFFQRSTLRLPGYQFAGQQHCIEQSHVALVDPRPQPCWQLQSLALADSNARQYRLNVDAQSYPHMADHQILGKEIAAAACYLSLLIAVAQRTATSEYVELKNVAFKQAFIAPTGPYEFQITLDDRNNLTLYGTVDGNQWQQLVTCTVAAASVLQSQPDCNIASYQDSDFYQRLEALGYQLGPAYRWLTTGEQVALSRPMKEQYWGETDWHPGLIDSCFHALVCQALREGAGFNLMLPLHIESLKCTLNPAQQQLDIRAIAKVNGEGLLGSLDLYNGDQVLLQVSGIEMRKANPAQLTGGRDCYRMQWQPYIPDAVPQYRQQVLVLSNAFDWQEQKPLFGADSKRLLVVCPPLAGDTAKTALSLCYQLCQMLNWLSQNRPQLPLIFVFSECESGEILCPVQSALWSMLASAAKELVGLSLGRLIYPSAADYKALETLLATTTTGLSARYYQGRFERQQMTAVDSPTAQAAIVQGDILVTGANGALAFELIKQLRSKCRGRLLLMSRNGVDNHKLAFIEQQPGAAIVEICGDLSQPEVFVQLNNVLASNRLDSVYHLAGSLADKAMTELTQTDFERVFAAKVIGGQALVDYLERSGRVNTTVVAFSSLAAVIGNPGQVNYTAANGYLDGLMRAWQAQGRSAVSLNLGPWQLGMVNDQQIDRWGRMGLTPLEAEPGISRCLSAGNDNLIIAKLDPVRLAGGQLDNPWLSYFAPAASLRQTTALADNNSTNNNLVDLIKPYLPSISSEDHDEPLINLGVNSVTVLELKQIILAETGISLPVQSLFQNSIKQLQQVLGGAGKDGPVASETEQPDWKKEETVTIEL